MPERKLATVEEILALEPIDNADALELATVRGWGVVVRKGEFSVGEVVVYFEIDSFLDVERPEFAFLADRGTRAINDPEDEKKKLCGHALRTIKLRGQISQGLILPLDILSNHSLYRVGEDVTDELGVLKYEPYVKPQTGSRKLYTFPTAYAVKSDAERVQNLSPRQWDALHTAPGKWTPTLKLDGSSMTVWKDMEGVLRVASRNFEIVDDGDSHFSEFLLKYYEMFDAALSEGLAIQGELYGPGIQDNKLGVKEVSFAPFNVFARTQSDIIVVPRYRWDLYLEFDSPLIDMAVPELDMPFPKTIKEAVDQANDLRYANGSQAEGIVWHNSDPEVAKILGRNCWKSINTLFSLKHEN